MKLSSNPSESQKARQKPFSLKTELLNNFSMVAAANTRGSGIYNSHIGFFFLQPTQSICALILEVLMSCTSPGTLKYVSDNVHRTDRGKGKKPSQSKQLYTISDSRGA
jgi:hypothetical protein